MAKQTVSKPAVSKPAVVKPAAKPASKAQSDIAKKAETPKAPIKLVPKLAAKDAPKAGKEAIEATALAARLTKAAEARLIPLWEEGEAVAVMGACAPMTRWEASPAGLDLYVGKRYMATISAENYGILSVALKGAGY